MPDKGDLTHTGRDAQLAWYQGAPFPDVPSALQANKPEGDHDGNHDAREEGNAKQIRARSLRIEGLYIGHFGDSEGTSGGGGIPVRKGYGAAIVRFDSRR